MSEPKLPSEGDSDDGRQHPEVRLELTQAGVRQVLSLYAEEQAGRAAYAGLQIGFDDILQAALNRWRIVLACAVAGLLLGMLVLLVTTSLYSVTAQVVLERQDLTESGVGTGRSDSAFIATQAEIMQSRSVLAAAVALADPGPKNPATSADVEADPIAAALESIQASAISGTQVVGLSFLGPDPVYGARLLSATVEAYRDKLNADEQRNQAQRLAAKETEYAALIEETNKLEMQLQQLRRFHFAGGSAADAVAAQNQIIRSQTEQLSEVRQQRIFLENKLLAGSVTPASGDPATRSLQDRLFQAEAELGRVRQTLKQGHPTREAAEREVTLLRSQLADTIKATPVALARDVEAAKGVEAELALVLDVERELLGEIEHRRRDEQLVIDELEQTKAMVELRRRALLDQRLMSRLAEAGEVGVTARLIAEPVQPVVPTWPNPTLVLVLGLLLGGSLGVGWAVIALRREPLEWQPGMRPIYSEPRRS